jgi:hypothetical protein
MYVEGSPFLENTETHFQNIVLYSQYFDLPLMQGISHPVHYYRDTSREEGAQNSSYEYGGRF